MPTTPSPFKPEDYKDKCANWRSPQGITVPVRVLNARRAYGRIELQVTPLNGTGKAWVQAAYVTFDIKSPINILVVGYFENESH